MQDEVKELVTSYITHRSAIKVIRLKLLQYMQSIQPKSKKVGQYRIQRTFSFGAGMTLEQARELGATRMIEQKDQVTLRRLHQDGAEIPCTESVTILGGDDKEESEP